MRQLESRKGTVTIDVEYYDDLKRLELELHAIKQKEKDAYNEIGECLARFIIHLAKNVSYETIMGCMTDAGYTVTYTDSNGGRTICGRGNKEIKMIKK